jgi:hypothetical protein
MLRRRKPVVILLSAEELALLTERAAEHGADPYDYAQVLFRSALGEAEDDGEAES